jgi:hypothetical protein
VGFLEHEALQKPHIYYLITPDPNDPLFCLSDSDQLEL